MANDDGNEARDREHIENFARTSLFLILSLLALIVLTSLFWGQISKGFDYINAFTPNQAPKDLRFYVIIAALFVSWFIFSFFALAELREKLNKNPVLWGIVTILSLLVLAVLVSFLRNLHSIDSKESAITVVNALQRIPTDWRFYAIALALAGLWSSRRFYFHTKLQEKLNSEKETMFEEGLEPRDWWTYRRFRERALTLRTRAGLTLGGVFALLFGGIYLILFIIPQLEASDRNLIATLQRQHFLRNFGNDLQAMAEGRYWFKTLNQTPNRSQFGVSVITFGDNGKYRVTRYIPGSRRRTASSKYGLIALTDGMIFVTNDGGETWQPLNSDSKDRGWISVATITKDGKYAMLLDNKNSVIMLERTNGSELEKTNEGELKEKKRFQWNISGRVIAALLSNDGRLGLLVDSAGSVFTISKKNGTWEPKQTKLDFKSRNYLILAATLSDDGKQAIIVGNEMSTTEKNGRSSRKWHNKFSVFKMREENNGGLKWEPERKNGFTMEDKERIAAVELSDDGKHGLIVGSLGSVFSMSDGKNFSEQNSLSLDKNEFITALALGSDGNDALLVSNKGLVFSRSKNVWKQLSLPLESEQIVAVALSGGGRHGLVVGRNGTVFSVFLDSDNQLSSRKKKLTLTTIDTWRIRTTLSYDGQYGLIGSIEGQVFVTSDGGQNWKETKWDTKISGLDHLISVPLAKGAYLAVAVVRNGDAYLLKMHPDIAGWNRWPLLQLEKEISKNKHLRKSRIFQQIKTVLADANSISKAKRPDAPNHKQQEQKDLPTNKHQSIFGITLNDRTVMRIATMTVLFFLVQLLVRLYQYSMRLANFWDSRADAILLDENFAADKAERFDDLVLALAPDTYDFKPMPRSPLDWLPWSRKNQ